MVEPRYKKCLVPKCDGVAVTRGVCVNCYNLARRMIDVGETTWEELESKGLCAKRTNRGREGRLREALRKLK